MFYPNPNPRPKKYRHCPDGHGLVEECQSPQHLRLAKTGCMECGGGVVDLVGRICANCIDLPFRKIREGALGRPIVYTTERPRSHLL